MILPNVWVVHGIAAILFSCRWAFLHDGIRTVLNDQQFLVLPDGDEVRFSEHSPHYAFKIHSHTVLLARSDDPTNQL